MSEGGRVEDGLFRLTVVATVRVETVVGRLR